MPAELVKIAKKPLSEEEQTLLNQLTRPGVKVDVIIPATIAYDDWIKTTSLVCRAYAKVELQRERLFAVLGRLLVTARDNPDLWKSRYEKWEDFLAGEVYGQWGVGRSTCFEAMSVVTRFAPLGLQVKDFEAIGRTGFKILRKAVPVGQEANKWAVELVDMAREVSTRQLEEHCEEKGYLTHGEVAGGFIRIPTSKRTQRQWEKFAGRPEVQAYCGTDRPDKILERLMHECEIEWINRGEKQLSRETAG